MHVEILYELLLRKRTHFSNALYCESLMDQNTTFLFKIDVILRFCDFLTKICS